MSLLLDEETVVLEGLDFEVPCEAGDHAADVWVQCRTCRKNAGALCRDHLSMKRAEAAMKVLIGGRLGCAMCEAISKSFDDLFEVVPL